MTGESVPTADAFSEAQAAVAWCCVTGELSDLSEAQLRDLLQAVRRIATMGDAAALHARQRFGGPGAWAEGKRLAVS
jgi:hypothetical protein